MQVGPRARFGHESLSTSLRCARNLLSVRYPTSAVLRTCLRFSNPDESKAVYFLSGHKKSLFRDLFEPRAGFEPATYDLRYPRSTY